MWAYATPLPSSATSSATPAWLRAGATVTIRHRNSTNGAADVTAAAPHNADNTTINRNDSINNHSKQDDAGLCNAADHMPGGPVRVLLARVLLANTVRVAGTKHVPCVLCSCTMRCGVCAFGVCAVCATDVVCVQRELLLICLRMTCMMLTACVSLLHQTPRNADG